MARLAAASSLVVLLALAPSAAHAQASIAGTVKDPTGAVLPGVTVEAASPALIEKVRAAVTDGTGQYRIVDLRAGTYTVTFTLTGFSTVKREGIELTGIVHRDGQRRSQGRRARGDDHRHRRNADRRRAERAAADDGQRRRHRRRFPRRAPMARIFSLNPGGDRWARAPALDVQVMPGLAVFGGAGRPRHRRPPAAGRPRTPARRSAAAARRATCRTSATRRKCRSRRPAASAKRKSAGR